ncbi:hypothetical protein [Pectobacterium brasiliense]|uniref:hypothetical protein n=1 Tax=Pectobacterium brasiliense TaxID=180957 RepID=UPI001969716B|nr:hypothetical protein [Pectobacterium brasiliense]MBN3123222.1 hypothetical protein [Pectobacterium brasiliense]
MKAYKTLLAQLDQERQQVKVQARHEAIQASVTKSRGLASELDALIDKYSATFTEAQKSAEEGRKIKSRGVALVHASQGGPANGRAVSLLTKSVESLRSVEINKASRTLSVTYLRGEK